MASRRDNFTASTASPGLGLSRVRARPYSRKRSEVVEAVERDNKILGVYWLSTLSELPNSEFWGLSACVWRLCRGIRRLDRGSAPVRVARPLQKSRIDLGYSTPHHPAGALCGRVRCHPRCHSAFALSNRRRNPGRSRPQGTSLFVRSALIRPLFRTAQCPRLVASRDPRPVEISRSRGGTPVFAPGRARDPLAACFYRVPGVSRFEGTVAHRPLIPHPARGAAPTPTPRAANFERTVPCTS